MIPELVIGDRAYVESALMSQLHTDADAAIHERGTFVIALAGGSIAELFFPSLARLPLDWSRIDFFWVDERAVPPDHPDSNFGEAERLWLRPAGVPSARVHRIHAEDPNLERAADAYTAELVRVAGSPPAIDFALLGVGPDGHIASLFPDHAALREERPIAVAINDAPKPPPRRITLTLPVLAASRRVVVAAQGEAKAEIVRRTLWRSAATPLGLLIARARNLRVLLVK